MRRGILTLALAIPVVVLGVTIQGGRAASAPALPAGLSDGGAARAIEIVDGDTLVLDDGRQVRLVGIQAPKLPLGRAGFKAWPLARDAKQALSALALGQSLTLAYGGRRIDRHGRALAQLFDAEGGWIQGQLLSQGMARVYSFADNRALVPEMLARESAARAARRGIWANSFYAVRTPEQAARHIGGFELVEGRVRDVAVVRGRVYLNFGEDWREDFTVTLSPKVRRTFEAENILPEMYRERIVRARGWLKSFNGPMIEATHPEQIEVIDP
jgi:endonuclease YncB( thermonuclease family)